MKAVTLYTIAKELGVEDFDLDKLNSLAYTPLSDLQTETYGFVPVHEDELYSLRVDNYMAFKLCYTKRDDVQEDLVQQELDRKIRELGRKGVTFEMDELHQEVFDQITRTTKSKTTEVLFWFDINNNRFISAASPSDTDKVIGLMLQIIPKEQGVELYTAEPALIEKMMSKWVIDKEAIENIDFRNGGMLSAGTLVGKKPSTKNGKSAFTNEEDFVQLAIDRIVNDNYKPHQLDLIYSGCCTAQGDAYFNMQLSNKSEFKGIKFPKGEDGSMLNYTYDHSMTETLNFVAEWLPIMPVVSNMLTDITTEISNTKLG